MPPNYGAKSTVHRHYLELCETRAYPATSLNLLRVGYEIQKIDLLHCATDTKEIQAKKGDLPVKVVINDKEERTKYSGGSEWFPLPTWLHPLMSMFPGFTNQLSKHSRFQLSTSPLDHLRRCSLRCPGRFVSTTRKFDPETYKRCSTIEHFFSRIGCSRRSPTAYECYETSFLGLIHLICYHDLKNYRIRSRHSSEHGGYLAENSGTATISAKIISRVMTLVKVLSRG